MNWIDVIFAIPLFYALWKGFSEGVIIQLGGIVAILIGVFLASKFSTVVAGWLSINQYVDRPLAFLIIVVAAIIIIGFGGKFLSRIVNTVGLTTFNKVAGALFSLLKMSLILGVIVFSINALNNKTHWIEQQTIDNSLLYTPLNDVAETAFPYLDKIIKK